MAALEYFQWLITNGSYSRDEELRALFISQREYLLSLRNEDERQRFVDELVRDVKLLSSAKGRRHAG